MGILISRSSSAGVPSASSSAGVLSACLLLSRSLISLLVLLAAILLATPSSAQTTSPATPKPSPAKGKSTAPGANETTPANVTPSRFVVEEDLAEYVASRSAVFSMRERTNDPFGQLQDPTAKRLVKATTAKPTRRIAPLQATPFSEIIRLIKVTTIMPGEKRFLVGTRSFKLGDRISLLFRGKTIPVEVSAVSANQIEFRNLDNNETALIKLNQLPDGMTLGAPGSTPPGMVKDLPESPLDLESGNTPNLPHDNSKNR